MRPGSLQATIDVRLAHSDAAGVVFFANAFVIEQELFERWLEAGGMRLREMLDGTLAPTPVVHCEADFARPVRVGDRMVARLAGVGIGETSFVLSWTMELDGAAAISARVRRVAVDPASGRAVGLPDRLRTWLESCRRETATLS